MGRQIGDKQAQRVVPVRWGRDINTYFFLCQLSENMGGHYE